MNPEILTTILTGASVLVMVWRMMESMRRELRQEMNTRFEGVNTQIGELRKEMNTRFDAVNARIDGVNTRIDGVHDRISNIVDRIATPRAG